jgi:AraC-like DNA-binding protein
MTGCSQVYNCHVGLTDIAVPVICDEQYLGTLFSGQILTSPPTPEGFGVVLEALKGQPHINWKSLESAYYQVPVVSQAQVAEMVHILELFARYISNSWKRLRMIGEYQRSHDRELSLDRKELASILLSGDVCDPQEVRSLSRRSGLARLPVRVLVVQIGQLPPDSAAGGKGPMTLNRLSHVLEDFSQGLPNCLATVIRPGEICLFTSQEGRNPSHHRLSLEEMAQNILGKLRSLARATGRIGISDEHRHPGQLLKAYQEACAALESNSGSVVFFGDRQPHKEQAPEVMARLVKALRSGSSISAAMQEFLALVMRKDRTAADIQQSRALLTWAIEHLALETVGIGLDAKQVAVAKEQAITSLLHAPSPFSACEAFRKFADFVSGHLAFAFDRREHKIVLGVTQAIEEQGAAQVTIQQLAAAVHLSSGHLSRVFRRTTGMTLEQFLIRQRIELAKQALLDPRLNVAEVAERCGFCNPAYFASVFRKYVSCTPREFASQPHRWEPFGRNTILPSLNVAS